MKTTKVLKTIIDILYILLAFGVFLVILLTIVSLFTLNFDMFLIISSPIKGNNAISIVLAIINITSYIFFFIGIGYLRETVKAFLKKEVYSVNTSKYFKLSGIYLIVCSLILLTNQIFFKHYYIQECKIPDMNIKESYLLFFMLICGLCFILISRIIKESIVMKEDNDLTI